MSLPQGATQCRRVGVCGQAEGVLRPTCRFRAFGDPSAGYRVSGQPELHHLVEDFASRGHRLRNGRHGQVPDLVSERGNGCSQCRTGGGGPRCPSGRRRSESRGRLRLCWRGRRNRAADARFRGWYLRRRRVSLVATSHRRVHGARSALARGGDPMGCTPRVCVSLRSGTSRVRGGSRFVERTGHGSGVETGALPRLLAVMSAAARFGQINENRRHYAKDHHQS